MISDARKLTCFLIAIAVLLAGCGVPAAVRPPEMEDVTPSIEVSVTPVPSATRFLLPTLLPTETVSPTATVPVEPTRTPRATATEPLIAESSPPASGTQVFLQATITEQSNCRVGPGVAYLYTHAMYVGDVVTIAGRNLSASWLWIKPANLDRYCWASATVMDIQGEKTSVGVTGVKLPYSKKASAPWSVSATREGDKVVISWSEVSISTGVHMGYLLEMTVCQQGIVKRFAISTRETRYIVNESGSCEVASGGYVYMAEENGYSDPVAIPWP